MEAEMNPAMVRKAHKRTVALQRNRDETPSPAITRARRSNAARLRLGAMPLTREELARCTS
jgi:hypothetical protein